MANSFAIRRVDGSDDHWAEELHILNLLCFARSAPKLKSEETEGGYWWLVFDDDKPIAFGGLIKGRINTGYGYLARVGVLPEYRGHGLHRRLIRVRERYARRLGWTGCVSDTSNGNVQSANNLIAEGYETYVPSICWGFSDSTYWRKTFA